MRKFFFQALLILALCDCRNSAASAVAASAAFTPSPEFSRYWLSGTAELARFSLSQARYSEIHNGELVVITVSEPFRSDKQVKSELTPGVNEVTVLKVQQMRRFATGIYDYALTTTSFKPLDTAMHPLALKVTGSAVDWCGQAWLQLNLKKGSYAVQGRSYFEESGDEDFAVPGIMSEDEIWQRIRLQPTALPQGTVQVIPSLFSSRLRHRKLAAEQANAELLMYGALKQSEYSLVYALGTANERRVSFIFENNFPHRILEYRETYMDGFEKPKKLTTIARLKKTVNTAYWREHDNNHRAKRRALGVTGFD